MRGRVCSNLLKVRYYEGIIARKSILLCSRKKTGEIKMNIFVGNLMFDANEGDIKKLFEGFGNVVSVVIVMSKDKKMPKSRGFGFVQMPDEQQALAAIEALNGKEFMGRALNVNPGRSKIEILRESELKKKKKPRFGAKAGERFQKQRERKKAWFSPVFDKYSGSKAPRSNGRAGTPPSAVDKRDRPSGRPGTSYRAGTRSYDSRRGSDGVQEKTKPWRKPDGEAKPWKKTEGGFKPWRKSEGGTKPWKKVEGEANSTGIGLPRPIKEGPKPWRKPAGGAKPWKKSSDRPQKPRFKGRSKAGGYKP
ncbi:MAG: RNA-binding protein [Candidatus Omnitrophica bacterium]|nr:RNA-binding protein [Candidatus Omnitrophota bacterium]